MNETITLVFLGDGKCRMHCKGNKGKPKLNEGAQALLYMAAIHSSEGFEKEIEIITENVIHTKTERLQ